jgi:cellulose synthase (UDP-forming)
MGRARRRRGLDEPDRSRRLWAAAWGRLTIFTGLAYLGWVAHLAWRTRQWQDGLFVAAEAMAWVLLTLLAWDIWRRRGHQAQGLTRQRPWTVDLLIPCCGEPLEVIAATLQAARRMDYPDLQVYVLDDGGAPAVAALAQGLGVHYLSRPNQNQPLTDAKAGNLNFGLARSQGELVLVLDADQVPQSDLAARLAGFFELPRVGFVQSLQAFFLPEGDPFYNSDRIFYETMQPSNDAANAVISCGSGVIYRRQALMEMGGFAAWNLVEDFTTSYELLSRGWQGLYFPYALSRGLAPATLPGVYRQRFQWALDTLRLFIWDNPLWKPGFTWRQRRHFLIVMLSYLTSGLVFPVFFAIPLLVYASGYSSLLGHELTYWALRGLYLVSTVCMFRYMFYGQEPLKQFKMLCSLFPVYLLALVAALLHPPGRKPAYRVNNLQPFNETGRWWHVAPHLGFIGLHLALPFASLWQGWAPARLIVFNALFSAFIIWVLADLVLAVLLKPRYAPAMDPRQVYG